MNMAGALRAELLHPSMSDSQRSASIFTIVGGTTIPERARIVKAHCREGSVVELRRERPDENNGLSVGVWLECVSARGLISTWKKMGHVPSETADTLKPFMDESSAVVARGTVCKVYAPTDREEAAVVVQIRASARQTV